MVSRKKDFEKAINNFGKEVDKLTSKLPQGSATDRFIGRWEALKKRLDEIRDNMPG
jgi:hypothetical protein